MLEKIKSYWIYIVIFVFVFLLNSIISLSPGDDQYFKNISNTMNLYDFLYMRYTIWSGRLFADSLLYLLLDKNIWIWRIFNSIFIFSLAVAIARIFTRKLLPQHFLVSFLTICCMSFNVISSGYLWVTGSINYSWPILLSILCLIPYADIIFNRKPDLKKITLLFSALVGFLAACSNEQVTLCLVGFITMFHLFMILKKDKRHLQLLIPSILIIIGAVIIFKAPGSDLRWQQEAQNYFPGFETFSLKEHLYVGIIWFYDRLVNEMRGFILLLSLVVIVKIIIKRYCSSLNAAFIIMFIVYVMLLINNSISLNLFDLNNIKFFDISENIFNPLSSKIDFWKSLFPYIFWTVYLIILFSNIILASQYKVFISLCLTASIASMIVMFASPTIYASGNRTLSITAILFCIVLFESVYSKLNTKVFLLFFAIYPLANILALLLKWILNGYAPLY